MLFSTPSSTSLLFSVLLATTKLTEAAPTRTHCRCALVSTGPSPAIDTPSAAHWKPSDPSPSSTIADICSGLGPELESFRHSEPDLYDSYVGRSRPEEPQHPIPTRILMAFAGKTGAQRGSATGEPRPTARSQQQRIVCRSEAEPFDVYQGSFMNLWALQLVLGFAVFACAAEGIHLGMRWMNQRMQSPTTSTPASPVPEKSRLWLPGGERRLLAIPPTSASAESVFSPGAEKKLRAYESTRYFVTQTPSGRREFIAYDDEDDDEANRPVM